jgi:hypothetical protein
MLVALALLVGALPQVSAAWMSVSADSPSMQPQPSCHGQNERPGLPTMPQHIPFCCILHCAAAPPVVQTPERLMLAVADRFVPRPPAQGAPVIISPDPGPPRS